MRARLLRVPLAAALPLALATCTGTHTASVSPTRDTTPLDSLFAAYAPLTGPGASVVVVRAGMIAYEKSFGAADVEARVPATPRTNYRLASLTKEFTAMAVMLLVQDGKLRYDEPLTAIFPELPAWGRGITLRNLLNHTSGIWDYEDLIPDSQTTQVHDRDVLALVARQDSTYFKPGSAWRYSNTGYALLSLAVERASGMSFARFLHDRIFAPLGMEGTVAHVDGVDSVPRRAFGYTVDSSGVHRTDQSTTSAVLGDGGIYSSVADLARWAVALAMHTLLDSAAFAPAVTPVTLADGTSSGYGMGWFVDSYGGTTRYWHYGETRGFANVIFRFPERRLTIVILANRNGDPPKAIAERIADRYLISVR
ncbi:MAG TPA: serine hydrolase domain-containing protein [Gemmatimonadales bacterium]|nr:serine hydrolase domain-containing protein [Gemmatimonadales bacterium]